MMAKKLATRVISAKEQRGLAAAAILVGLIAVYAVRSADPDLWGHLRYGQHILNRGGHVGTDPFAYSTTGLVWNDHEYVAQMALWIAYAHGGVLGLILLKYIVGVATMYFLYRAVRLGSDVATIWAPLFILVAGGVGRWLVFRPQLFTFLLMSVFVRTLFRHLLLPSPPEYRRRGGLWLLPLLFPLWVNLHGGFLAGLGAVGLALLLRSLQSVNRHGFALKSLFADTLPLQLTLAACFAGSLLNPLGVRLWPYLLTELGFSENRVFIKEWQPIWQVWDLWPTLVPFFVLLAVVLFVGVAASWKGKRIADLPAWIWLLSCLPLTLMAFQSNRHIPVQITWAAPVAGLLAGAARDDEQRVWKSSWLAVTSLAGIVAVMAVFPVALDPRPRISLGPSAFGSTRPDRAVAFMKVNELEGRVYTPLWWGSYLTWELYPTVLVSIDGRNVTLFARETVTANFRFYTDRQPDLATPRRDGTDYLLVSTDTPGLEAIRADSYWIVLYEDRDAVLFVRADDREMLGKRDRGELKLPGDEAAEFFR